MIIYHVMIPLPPSVNRIWRKNKFGSIYLTPEGEEYKNNLLFGLHSFKKKVEAELSYHQLWWTDLQNIIFNMKYFFKDERRRDTHNYIKIIADAFQDVFEVDDRHFLFREIEKVIDKSFKQHGVLLQLLFVPKMNAQSDCFEYHEHYHKFHPFDYPKSEIDRFLSESI